MHVHHLKPPKSDIPPDSWIQEVTPLEESNSDFEFTTVEIELMSEDELISSPLQNPSPVIRRYKVGRLLSQEISILSEPIYFIFLFLYNILHI